MTNTKTHKEKLMLLMADFNNPVKDIISATLAWMCKEHNWKFDIYYTQGDKIILKNGDTHIHKADQGGLFSAHGSTLFGGRHYQAIARAFAEFEVTVIMLDNIMVFNNLINSAAKQIITFEGIVKLYKNCSRLLNCKFPDKLVAIQTEDLPIDFKYGIAQFIYPDIVYSKAMGVPIGLSITEIEELNSLGVKNVAIHTLNKNSDPWENSKFNLKQTKYSDHSYGDLTFNIVKKWYKEADGFDLCEPVLASYWLPYSIQENRLHFCSEKMKDAVDRLAPLVEKKGQKIVYGRYAGGPICRADDDEDLFGLFKKNIAFEVVEPGRPVLRVFSQKEKKLADIKSPFEQEPSDDKLLQWAQKGKILTTLTFHSGELSHNDSIINVMELSALTNVKIGIPVHVQRYVFDFDYIEPMYTPVKEGGVLGLCEPVLHSGGIGIIAESLADSQKIANMMKEAYESIMKITGKENAPRGIYCYLDAFPDNWNKSSKNLWQKVGEAGFEYIFTSVKPGNSRVLFQDKSVTVLNLQSYNYYPYSPFIRVNSVSQMVEMERSNSQNGQPAWLNAVIDTPIFASSSYLLKGKSRPTADNYSLYRGANLGSFFEYIAKGGETHKLISATPHTIYRYAKLLKEKGYIE